MNLVSTLLAAALLVPVSLLAQKASVGDQKGSETNSASADARWAGLSASLEPTAKAKLSVSSAKSDLATTKNLIAQQADASRQVAADAKAFYTQFPTNANAEVAKKIEVIAELRGVKEDDAAHEKKATDMAKAFRSDTSHSVAARAEVALAADRLALSRKIKARTVEDRPAEKEKLADALKTEFGLTQSLTDYYVEVARGGDMFTAKRIATNLTLAPQADRKAKTEAQLILDRSALIGQKLNLKFNSLDTGLIDLAQMQGVTTVVFVWTPTSGENMLKSLARFQNSIPPGVQFVYVTLGGTAKEAAAMNSLAPIRGRLVHLPANTFGPTLAALKTRNMPYLYVLNRESQLVGFGPVSELIGLLSLAR